MTSVDQYVFVLSDDPAVTFHLRGSLENAGYPMELLGSLEALLARLSGQERGCLLVDADTAGLDRSRLQAALHQHRLRLPLVFLGSPADVPTAVAAMKDGALDFLVKPVEPSGLISIVAHALRVEAEAAAAQAEGELAQRRWSALSPRERDVCCLCAKGLLNKEIAAVLGTAPVTVQAQRARALQKLRVGSMVELIRLVEQVGCGAKPGQALD